MSYIANAVNKTSDASGLDSQGSDAIKKKKKGELDENAFLQILTAELNNQDPTKSVDSTQLISQMAQFSALQQMTNLNQTMSLSSANGLIGKYVDINQADDSGQLYSGTVLAASKNGSNVTLQVQVSDGSIKEFSLSDVLDVAQTPDSVADSNNSKFLNTASLIGKNVKLNGENGDKTVYTGTIQSITRDSNGIKLNVKVSSSSLNSDMNVLVGSPTKNPSVSGVYTGKDDKELDVRYLESTGGYQYKYSDTDTWNDMKDNTVTVDGVTITKPSANPSKEVIWNVKLSPATKDTVKTFSADDLVEVDGQ